MTAKSTKKTTVPAATYEKMRVASVRRNGILQALGWELTDPEQEALDYVGEETA